MGERFVVFGGVLNFYEIVMLSYYYVYVCVGVGIFGII